eukprot:jgi/Ulvmu1/12264/UM086_0057.1
MLDRCTSLQHLRLKLLPRLYTNQLNAVEAAELSGADTLRQLTRLTAVDGSDAALCNVPILQGCRKHDARSASGRSARGDDLAGAPSHGGCRWTHHADDGPAAGAA